MPFTVLRGAVFVFLAIVGADQGTFVGRWGGSLFALSLGGRPKPVVLALADVEPVVLLGGEGKQGLLQGLLDGTEHVLVGGSSVEYWWPAVAFGLAVWSYTRRPSWAAAAVAVLACAALWFVNRNLWALAALPVLFLASRVDVRVPRLRWAFYAYYPLHLASLWLIRIPMSKAGYLFF